jgi:plastocyanin
VKGKVAITLLVVAAIAGLKATDAGAQTVSVSAGGAGGNVFTPSSVTITLGQSVTWTNAGGNHNVAFADGLFTMPGSFIPPPWQVTRTFNSPGAFTYICANPAHGGMSGTVTVNSAAPTPTPTSPTPTPTPTPTTPTTPVTDSVAPKATRVVASGTLTRAVVKLRLDEAATVTARLTRSGQTRTLKRVTRKLAAGSRQITLSRTLSNGKRYRIALRIVDAAGNVATRTISFTAKR